ncbi:MAG: hypothetical protein HC927_12755, partial [Deltaproteobacteria bacterium]|nr:hypothetical protein [Deltaproteobacteria bacterium]
MRKGLPSFLRMPLSSSQPSRRGPGPRRRGPFDRPRARQQQQAAARGFAGLDVGERVEVDRGRLVQVDGRLGGQAGGQVDLAGELRERQG